MNLSKFLSENSAKLLVVLILLPLLVVGVYLVRNQTVLRPKAAEVKVSLSPTSVNKNVGEEFSVVVNLDPGGVNVVGVDLEIDYDSQKFEINNQSITTGVFGSFPQKEIDSSLGKVKIAGVTFDRVGQKPTVAVSSSANFLTLIFKAKGSGTGKISIVNGSVVDKTGNLINLQRGAEVTAQITGNVSTETNSTASFDANYSTSPLSPIAGQEFVINIQTNQRNLTNPAVSIDGTLFPAEVTANGYRFRGTLTAGKHVLQLLANCKKEPNLNCAESNLGFDPYIIDIRSGSTQSANNYDLNLDTVVNNKDVVELLNNWGGSKGDFNNNGKVDIRDFATIFLITNP